MKTIEDFVQSEAFLQLKEDIVALPAEFFFDPSYGPHLQALRIGFTNMPVPQAEEAPPPELIDVVPERKKK